MIYNDLSDFMSFELQNTKEITKFAITAISKIPNIPMGEKESPI